MGAGAMLAVARAAAMQSAHTSAPGTHFTHSSVAALSLCGCPLRCQVVGVLANSVWPNAAFAGAALLGASFIGLLLAVRYRSKRILLLSQAACLFLYSAFLVITCGVVFQPTVVDAKVGAGGGMGRGDCSGRRS